MNKTQLNQRLQDAEKKQRHTADLYVLKKAECRKASAALALSAADVVRLTRELAHARKPWWTRAWLSVKAYRKAQR